MREEEGKQKITILVPVRVVNKLKQLASEHQRSFNGEIVWALQGYIEQSAKRRKSTSDHQ